MSANNVSSGSALFDLLRSRRQGLIDRWMHANRMETTADSISTTDLLDRIPFFIDELIVALHPEALPLPALGETAIEHGAQRLKLGFDVGEVVREYGVLHRSIMEIAGEADVAISRAEHQIIAKWLNAGIASAVSQYVSERDAEVHRNASEHLGFIAHEIRNPLSSARMAFEILRRTDLVKGGRAVELLNRNLRRIVDVIDNALSHASMKMGVVPRIEIVALRKLAEEIEFDAGAETEEKGIKVIVEVSDGLNIEADVRLLRSALSNLFHNAVKFSHPGSRIVIRAYERPGEVKIEVEDSCGGLPPGRAQDLFMPLVQRGADQSGFGLGLSIALQAAEAHNGTIRVRDLPGQGCVFVIDLPARTGQTPLPTT
ncbi:MAG: HAMP domain-containing histidine kinase [Deltaproteobacteria bacterium]|nr:HAMP domain-containing histidine kinase [Deltaproteobacteria bacterium]